MPRKNRIWYPGAIYHVMSRGNRKEPIFKDKGDYRFFLDQVKDVKKIYPFKLHSICMMPNHFHFELETEDVEPGKIMSKILSPYASFFNGKHSLSGHLFGGRYKACLIESDAYFLEVSRYIHLNPVKAMMVKTPLDYEYSSYQLYVSREDSKLQPRIYGCMEDLIDTSRILGYFANDRNQYRLFVEDKMSHEQQEHLIMKDMNEDEMWMPKEGKSPEATSWRSKL